MAPRTIRNLVKLGCEYGPTWRYVFNLRPTVEYGLRPRRVDGEAARVLAGLNRDGIAISSVDALLDDTACYDELVATVDRLEEALADSLAASRAEADATDAIGEKTFMHELLGSRPQLDPTSVFARFALQERVLDIANAYFGMLTRLRYYNVWHTLSTRSRPRESQLWHRDREDRQILKVFLFLSDVDEGAGPFVYATGSHVKGTLRREPDYVVEGGVKRSDDGQMAAVVPPDRWIKGVGPKGALVFADTHGFHKGGLARDRDRILYTCMFTSAASRSRDLFTRPAAMSVSGDRSRSFALA